jgi:Family of unknown function (DUF6529)
VEDLVESVTRGNVTEVKVGFEDEQSLHVIAAIALLAVLALKVLVVRRLHFLGRFLPIIGLSVFVLLAVTWASSAGDFLASR